MGTAEDERKKRGFERFLLFTDAVMAIAVTLLILPVVDEVLQLENRDREVMDLLGDLGGELFGFFVSFTVLVVLWMSHKDVFVLVAVPNAWLLRLNVLWLLSITLLPFTTALIAHHGDEQATVLLYIGNLALSLYCLGGSLWILSRNPHLLLPGASVTTYARLDAMLNSAMVTLAFIMAVLFPGLGFAVMLLMILPELIKRLWERRSATT